MRQLLNLEVSSTHRIRHDLDRVFSQKSRRPIVYKATERWLRGFLSGGDQDALYLATTCLPRLHASIPDFARRLLQTTDAELHRIALRLTDDHFIKSLLFLLPLLPHLGFTVFEWGSQVRSCVLLF